MTGKYALRRATGPNVYEAFRRVVYRFGVEKMAGLMGMKIGTLYNKCDAGDDSHNQPTLRDVLLATMISGDFECLDAAEEMFGRAAYDTGRHKDSSDAALLELLTRMGAESGEFHSALSQGLSAPRFTAERLEHIRGEGMDIVSALMTLLARLEGLVDDEA